MLGGTAIVFLLIFLGSFGAAYAQSETNVGAKYIVRNAGFEMQFPAGWNSTATSETYAIVTPNDVPDAVITVLVADRLETRKLMASEVGVESGRVAIYDDEACKSVEDKLVSLNGSRILYTVHECTGDQYSKTSTYVIFTLTRSIAVSLSASSPEAYDRHVAEFESSVKTIRIDEPIDFRVALEVILGATNIFTQNVDIEAANSQVKVVAATSSKVSAINFDEESRSLTVTVDEQKRSEGNLLVPVHRFILGPYQVYVDGKPAGDFLVIGDEGSDSQLVNVRYAKGAHSIEIVGTEVVPEFGPGIAAILAATMSAALLYLRRPGPASSA